MKRELKQHTRWARHDGGNRWTLGLDTPVPPQLLAWLTETYSIDRCIPLPSNTAAFLLTATPKTNATLLQLPKPKWEGSRHESNRVIW